MKRFYTKGMSEQEVIIGGIMPIFSWTGNPWVDTGEMEL